MLIMDEHFNYFSVFPVIGSGCRVWCKLSKKTTLTASIVTENSGSWIIEHKMNMLITTMRKRNVIIECYGFPKHK